ncbi:hypothetical protein QWZ10_02755 [Paracoccus cavernae]|uniref:Uncharacterized protein n=1 Tax=Paracoccus cavernae TaxID=1571207 RepID=A0ABT8D2Y7_9RHOB|nr:hypothetical protein [Paracoccus cavernae]
MSRSFDTPASQITDAASEELAENRIAARLLLGVAVLLAVVVVAVVIWGLPALTMIGLGATAIVLLLLLAYAAGF